MKITIKSKAVEIIVESDLTPPSPSQQWYGMNMISFNESILKIIEKATEKTIELTNSPQPNEH
jgi:hypothetical protein